MSVGTTWGVRSRNQQYEHRAVAYGFEMLPRGKVQTHCYNINVGVNDQGHMN